MRSASRSRSGSATELDRIAMRDRDDAASPARLTALPAVF
jgi:hypothetical protein